MFDEKLNKFGDCFEKAKNPESITHIQIFDNYGGYYFKKVNDSFKDVLQQFDLERQHLKNIRKLKSLHKGTKFKKMFILHSVYPF